MTWKLEGKRKKVRLNRHMITVIEPVPLNKIIPLKEGEAKLRKILLEAD